MSKTAGGRIYSKVLIGWFSCVGALLGGPVGAFAGGVLGAIVVEGMQAENPPPPYNRGPDAGVPISDASDSGSSDTASDSGGSSDDPGGGGGANGRDATTGEEKGDKTELV